jgi:hypothetical protein
MPRPKGRQLPHRVSVALTEDQFVALEGLASSNSAPVSWLVRRAVIEFLDRNRPDLGQPRLLLQRGDDLKVERDD